MNSTGNWEHVGKMIAAWLEAEDRWIMGRDLELAIRTVSSKDIIRNFKLMLYKEYQNSPQTKRVEEQLKAAQKDQHGHELLTEFLKYIWNDIHTYVNKELLDDYPDRAQYENIVYISVPALATPDATKRLRAAAIHAGLPRVEFVPEPLCAAATVLEEVLPRLNSVSLPYNYIFTFDANSDTAGGEECADSRLWGRYNGRVVLQPTHCQC